MHCRVHDLARIAPATVARLALPAWARASLERAPWVVVRRDGQCDAVLVKGDARGDAVAVGIRGATREQRYATNIALADIVLLRGPEDLVPLARASSGPLAEGARQVDEAARSAGLAWGPTGSYGFELASGAAWTHAVSDLDCVVRPTATSAILLSGFARACREIAQVGRIRIDVEVAFDGIGIALADYLSGDRRVVAKTPSGPAIVDRESLLSRA